MEGSETKQIDAEIEQAKGFVRILREQFQLRRVGDDGVREYVREYVRYCAK